MQQNPGERLLRRNSDEREIIWKQALGSIEAFFVRTDSLPVFAPTDRAALVQSLQSWDFADARSAQEAIEFAVRGLESQLQTSHSTYFGVFNPAPSTLGIVGDLLTASFNPQLASWTSAPFCIELEAHLARLLALKAIGGGGWEGNFTSGGAEANHSSVLLALSAHFGAWEESGVSGEPTLYVSTESHHSFLKAARACGLGARAVREVAVTDDLRMDVNALRSLIHADRAAGRTPFLLVGTAGTTGGGTIDDLKAIAEVAAQEKLWFHVDAAWGGAALLVPELRVCFDGIEHADSLTLDAHKWLNIPMGAGLLLTRHREARRRAFHVEAHYMPVDPKQDSPFQPYQDTLQWSRRCMGLKLFLTLATVGWEGIAEVIRHQVIMGNVLRAKLQSAGWKIEHPHPLPVVCFTDPSLPEGNNASYHEAIAKAVGDSGDAWLTTAKLGGYRSVLRAGIASYRTNETDLDVLVAALETARAQVRQE